MILKYLPGQVKAAIELACALAARELALPVPRPGLVVAEREFLTELPDSIQGEYLLLVGSHYQRPDSFMAEVTSAGDAAAEELIWRTVCSSPVGAPAAAFDELVANADRHCENMLFDGAQWWLFDHDAALPPASQYILTPALQAARLQAAEFMAKANQMAHEMLRRRPNDHGILAEPRRFEARSKRVHALAKYADEWTHEDPRIAQVLQLTGVVLGLIHLRLAPLAEHLHTRLNQAPPLSLSWS